MSNIEWTDETWNVTTGCTRVSAGCDNCYAVAMTKRLAGIGATKEKYAGLVNEGKNHFNGTVKIHKEELQKPLKWRKPRRVFVNSMSDLFHPKVPFEFIDKVFAVMAMAEAHTFQVLTKRPERMYEYFNRFQSIGEIKDAWGYAYVDWKSTRTARAVMNPDDVWDHLEHTDWPLPNVWLGTSVEDQEAAGKRIPHLLNCPARVRFLSCEPLLGPVDLKPTKALGDWEEYRRRSSEMKPGALRMGGKTATQMHHLFSPLFNRINWVIAGGESGTNARPMHPDWVRTLRDQCTDAQIPFFFKQWGAWKPGTNRANNEKVILNDGTLFNCPAPRELVMNLYSESEWNDHYPNAISRVGKKEAGRQLDGREWNQTPEATNE